jgi:hypothetical protein
MQIDPYLSHCTKLKSKWIKDLKIKPDRPSLIEEKVVNNLEHTAQGKFSEQNTDGLDSQSTIDKWDLMKLKSFCKAKNTVNRQNSNIFCDVPTGQVAAAKSSSGCLCSGRPRRCLHPSEPCLCLVHANLGLEAGELLLTQVLGG